MTIVQKADKLTKTEYLFPSARSSSKFIIEDCIGNRKVI